MVRAGAWNASGERPGGGRGTPPAGSLRWVGAAVDRLGERPRCARSAFCGLPHRRCGGGIGAPTRGPWPPGVLPSARPAWPSPGPRPCRTLPRANRHRLARVQRKAPSSGSSSETFASPDAASARSARSTVDDVARLAGVSKKTVSRVLNHSPLVHPDTRDRVLAQMRQMGFTPDPQARGLAFRRSFLIGLVFDCPNAQYIVDMQYGALDALRDSGFELIVHPCDSRKTGYVDGIRQFVQRQKLWGVILVPCVSEDQALAEALREIDCRYVRIAATALDDPARMVLTHDRLAGTEVAHYLESLGHRRFGLITGPERHRSSIERAGGFVEGLAGRGIELPAECIHEGNCSFESGVAGAERLLRLQPRPTAIFACSDEMAAGVYKATLRLGLSIPGDLSVVGHGDSPLAAQLWPALTSVHLPVRDLGRQAASMLLADQAPPRGAGPVSLVAATPHLGVRDSCQPPRPEARPSRGHPAG